MHPGNILVVARPSEVRTPARRLLAGLRPWDPVARVAMLDAGMAVSLSDSERLNMIRFFGACTRLDGFDAADAVVGLGAQSPGPAQRRRERAFRAAVGAYYGSLTDDDLKYRSSEILSKTMDLMRVHRVNISGEVSTILVQLFVLEGWASQLDRDVRIMEMVKRMMPGEWQYRMPGQCDRLMGRALVGMQVA